MSRGAGIRLGTHPGCHQGKVDSRACRALVVVRYVHAADATDAHSCSLTSQLASPRSRHPIDFWQARCSAADLAWSDWMPLGKRNTLWPPYQVTRRATFWDGHILASGVRGTSKLVEACWRTTLADFGLEAGRTAEPGPLNVTFYPCAHTPARGDTTRPSATICIVLPQTPRHCDKHAWHARAAFTGTKTSSRVAPASKCIHLTRTSPR